MATTTIEPVLTMIVIGIGMLVAVILPPVHQLRRRRAAARRLTRLVGRGRARSADRHPQP